jgi:hypothetical protein
MKKIALVGLVALAVAGSTTAHAGFGAPGQTPKSPGFKPLPSPSAPKPASPAPKAFGAPATPKPPEAFKPYEPWKPGSVYGKPK